VNSYSGAKCAPIFRKRVQSSYKCDILCDTTDELIVGGCSKSPLRAQQFHAL
jgi:hypothetical protein